MKNWYVETRLYVFLITKQLSGHNQAIELAIKAISHNIMLSYIMFIIFMEALECWGM